MAYNEALQGMIEEVLDEKKSQYAGKKMMGGYVFMVDDKMCVGIVKDMLMARIGESFYPEAITLEGVLPMDFTGRPMKGYVFIEPDTWDNRENLEFWIEKCLAFNPLAKRSKKKSRKVEK